MNETQQQLEWWRETVTMALYVSLSVLAVLVALPEYTHETSSDLGLTVLMTGVALLVAHQVAFRLSSKLVNQGLLDDHGRRLLSAQLVGGLAAAAVAALPIFLFGEAGVVISELLVLVFVAATGYRVARSVPTSRKRALVYVSFLTLVVLGVLFVKSLVGH